MEIIIEKSKNGLDTCKVYTNNSWRYIYSKYSPERIKAMEVHPNIEFIIILGIGLGYEFEYYKLLNIPIFVVESEKVFRDYVNVKEKVNYITLEQLKSIDFTKQHQIIEHSHLTELNPNYYKAFKNAISQRIGGKKRVCLLNHNSLLKDCAEAFEKIGYEVIILEWSHLATIKKELLLYNPQYVFSINYSLNLAGICEEFKIPYISWTVDTPSYSLFSKNIYQYTYSFKFVYDEEIVQLLKQQQVMNVFYLPVAANFSRYNEIEIHEDEKNKFVSDVTFLGNSCGHNEYLNGFEKLLSYQTKKQINELVNKQLFNDNFVIKDGINEKLITAFEQETGYSLFKEEQALLSKEKRLAYLLGRYHSYIERTTLIKELGKYFSIKIYGDDLWVSDREIQRLNFYQGLAENYIEMPKIFKRSKINLNNIRCFVESGLPQRVFDVLACGGFLVTNNKLDINKYFVNNRDLVVYRDLQDLKEIIQYYLEHDTEREQIALSGYEAVKQHTFESRILEMLKIVTKFL